MKDNRWTVRCTEWQVRNGKRSKGRPKRKWRDDIQQWLGATWSRKAKGRQKWRDLAEGYLQHRRDTAQVQGTKIKSKYSITGTYEHFHTCNKSSIAYPIHYTKTNQVLQNDYPSKLQKNKTKMKQGDLHDAWKITAFLEPILEKIQSNNALVFKEYLEREIFFQNLILLTFFMQAYTLKIGQDLSKIRLFR